MDERLAVELLERFGSPLFAYDLGRLERRAQELLGALPAGSTLFYSLKANPLPAIVLTLRRLGIGAEVSSPGELRVAQRAGFPGERILYSGPGKSEEELALALRAGVGVVSCESAQEVERLRSLAVASALEAAILLRVNPRGRTRARLAMSGRQTQFGLDEDQAEALVRDLVAKKGPLDLRGLHVYFGTQQQDAAAVAASFRAVNACARRLSSASRRPFEVLDFGGGFPWPFGVGQEPLAAEALRAAVSSVFEAMTDVAGGALWFESGRYLAASSGTLLTSVVDCKRSAEKRYVITDSGIHHLGGMAGLGRMFRPRLDVRVLGTSGEGVEPTAVVGCLCTPLDLLASVPLPKVSRGDVLMIPNVGAYGATASLTGFLSRQPAAEVAYRDKAVVASYRLRSGHAQIEGKTDHD